MQRLTVFSCSCMILCALLFSSGCAPGTKVTMASAFNPMPEQSVVYVQPFSNSLVPDAFSEAVFNDFVDNLNDNRLKTDVKWFYILKEDPKDIDPVWLAKQVYLTGEIWSYIENAGCCSTELRVTARLRLYEAGKKDPTLEILVPMESFFEHDSTTPAAERQRLAQRLAREMTDKTITLLAGHKASIPR